MKALNVEDIYKAEDVKREKLEVPEWGGFLYIQSMSGEALDDYEASMYRRNAESGEFEIDRKNTTAKLIAACCYDEQGNRLFKSDDHVKVLGKKNGQVLKRIWAKCQQVNGLSIEGLDDSEGKSETGES